MKIREIMNFEKESMKTRMTLSPSSVVGGGPITSEWIRCHGLVGISNQPSGSRVLYAGDLFGVDIVDKVLSIARYPSPCYSILDSCSGCAGRRYTEVGGA